MRPLALLAAAVLGLSLLHAGSAGAGHGLLNSFAGIEWLPDAGVTPDRPAYAGEIWAERTRLLLATDPAQTVSLCLGSARERLAEIEAMVRAGKPDAAGVAIAHYRAHLACASEAIAKAAGAAHTRLTLAMVDALLEHQYIMSTDYLDLPRGHRPVIATMMAAAGAAYGQLAEGLTRREREARFFKEEEVRWSWEMALAADAQGL